MKDRDGNASPCGVCEDVIGSGVSKKRSVLGCGHKLCNRCLAPRVRIIKADKIMVVKCPVEGCSAITVKPLPQKYCGSSSRDQRSDHADTEGKRTTKAELLPMQGTENEHDLTEAFIDADGNSNMFTVGFAKRLNFAAVLGLITGLMQHLVAMAYAATIVALAGGFIWGFDYGFAHSMVESLNHGAAKWIYPALLAGLFLMECAPEAPGRSMATLVCLDAVALAALCYAVLRGADFSYCHSIDRYLVMSVSSYWVPIVPAAALAVEVTAGLISLVAIVARHMHGLWARLFGIAASPATQAPPEQQLPQPPQSPPAAPASPPVRYYPRRHAGRQAAILLDSDLTVRCSSYAQAQATPVKPALSSPKSGTAEATCGSSGGARRRVSFTPALEETEIVGSSVGATPSPNSEGGSMVGDGIQPSLALVATCGEDSSACEPEVPAPSTLPPESPVHADIPSSAKRPPEGDSSDSEGEGEGDEQNTTAELWRVDTAPRILSGTAPAGYVLRARSPLWRAVPGPAPASDTPDTADARTAALEGSTVGDVDRAADRTTSEVMYNPADTSLLTVRQLEPDCATPTQRYRPASDDETRDGVDLPPAEERCGTDDTALLMASACSSGPATPQKAPGSGQLCTPDGHLPRVDSPEDDFKLHSNIKLKPLGTFSANGLGMGTRRQVQVCELSVDAATPVEGYTNAYLIAASERSTPSSPPSLRSALVPRTGAQREPAASTVTSASAPAPALQRATSKVARAQKDPGGKGEGKKPLFKNAFLGVTGRGGIIR